MKRLIVLAVAVLFAWTATPLPAADPTTQPSQEEKPVPAALNFTVKNIDDQDVALSKYGGKVVLIVNVASKCGNTPQYKALEALHEKYAGKGLAILGFPANNFGGQEPGSNEQIKDFCTSKYEVKFDMFSKVSVKGDDQCPLYKFLTAQEAAPVGKGDVTWNFEKFLLNRNGEVAARFKPRTQPDAPEVVEAIEKLLAAQPQ